jgi:hypothetical protein
MRSWHLPGAQLLLSSGLRIAPVSALGQLTARRYEIAEIAPLSGIDRADGLIRYSGLQVSRYGCNSGQVMTGCGARKPFQIDEATAAPLGPLTVSDQ